MTKTINKTIHILTTNLPSSPKEKQKKIQGSCLPPKHKQEKRLTEKASHPYSYLDCSFFRRYLQWVQQRSIHSHENRQPLRSTARSGFESGKEEEWSRHRQVPFFRVDAISLPSKHPPPPATQHTEKTHRTGWTAPPSGKEGQQHKSYNHTRNTNTHTMTQGHNIDEKYLRFILSGTWMYQISYNPSCSCQDILCKTTNVNLMATLDETSLGYIIWEPWMSEQKFEAVHPVDLEIFYWISENFDLLVALDEKWRVHQSQEDSSSGDHECRSCTTFHGNPSNSCWDFSVWTNVVDWQTFLTMEPHHWYD